MIVRKIIPDAELCPGFLSDILICLDIFHKVIHNEAREIKNKEIEELKKLLQEQK